MVRIIYSYNVVLLYYFNIVLFGYPQIRFSLYCYVAAAVKYVIKKMTAMQVNKTRVRPLKM